MSDGKHPVIGNRLRKLVCLIVSNLFVDSCSGFKDSFSQLLEDKKSPMLICISLVMGVVWLPCVPALDVSPHMAESYAWVISPAVVD